MNKKKEIEELKSKIIYIEGKQKEFGDYIQKLKNRIYALEAEGLNENESIIEDFIPENIPIEKSTKVFKPKQKKVNKPKPSFIETFIEKNDLKANWEEFIGTNLINKIGILILTIGVIIGAKYAIDKELISPLTRIIIGYTISASLLVFAIKLKAKYLNFSAVLLSGALCMLYFLSYISYDFYGFIPASVSFGLMLLFTIFSVFAALNYNKQIIALLGLVGSYAIPFLLSSGSGNYLFLFSYLALVNIALLYISFTKNWKPIFYTSFLFTWLIFISWLIFKFSMPYFNIALIFALLFYLTFYATFIAYKLIKKEVFKKLDVFFILANSFVFYTVGCFILNENSNTSDYLGLFTVLNAIIHFIVAKLFFKKENSDVNLFYLAIGLVFIFITIAIPVQLNGNWVTLFWLLEAGLLFSIGRLKQISFYEKLSYPVILISFIRLIYQFEYINYSFNDIKPFFNTFFVIAIIGIIVFGCINYFHFKKTASHRLKYSHWFKFLNFVLPVIFIITLFVTFSNEISQFFNTKISASKLKIIEDGYEYFERNYLLYDYKDLSILLYASLLVILFSILNLKFLKNKITNNIILISKGIMLFITLTFGLLLCSDIRSKYLAGSEFYDFSSLAIYSRYFLLILIGLITYLINHYINKGFSPFSDLKKYSNIFLHLVILWLLSSELLHWLDVFGNKNAYKLALSILWGSYSLLMVIIGLWKKQKFTRIAAIGLFAVTLVKLFFYDISNLSMIYKTIVFIVLGVLLLIISFLYNKYSSQNKESNE